MAVFRTGVHAIKLMVDKTGEYSFLLSTNKALYWNRNSKTFQTHLDENCFFYGKEDLTTELQGEVSIGARALEIVNLILTI